MSPLCTGALGTLRWLNTAHSVRKRQVDELDAAAALITRLSSSQTNLVRPAEYAPRFSSPKASQ